MGWRFKKTPLYLYAMDFGAFLITLSITAGLKLMVMLFSGWLLYRLYGTRKAPSQRKLWLLILDKDRDSFGLLYFSLWFFAFSEIFCGIETYVLLQSHFFMRYLHAITSAIGMGLFSSGMLMYLNQHFIFWGEKRCLVNKICQGCTLVEQPFDQKYCKFSQLTLITLIFLFFACVPALFTPTSYLSGDTKALILPFPSLNAWYDSTLVPWLQTFPGYKPIGEAVFLPQIVQIFEFKIIPIISMCLVAIGIYLYKVKLSITGIYLSGFAAGLVSYSYFEILSYRLTGNLFIGAFFHEIAEFFFLLIIYEFFTRAYQNPKRKTDLHTGFQGVK